MEGVGLLWQEKTHNSLVYQGVMGFIGLRWIMFWYRGPDSNRHDVTTGGF